MQLILICCIFESGVKLYRIPYDVKKSKRKKANTGHVQFVFGLSPGERQGLRFMDPESAPSANTICVSNTQHSLKVFLLPLVFVLTILLLLNMKDFTM